MDDLEEKARLIIDYCKAQAKKSGVSWQIIFEVSVISAKDEVLNGKFPSND
jgi:hypothetical protein